MRVGILAGSRGWHTDALAGALAARGASAAVLPIDALVGRVNCGPRLSAAAEALDRLDAVFVHTIPRGSLDQIVYRIDALHRLARLGVTVMNPATAIERTVDKFYTSTLLEDAGIPTPPTVVAERMDQAMEAFQDFRDVIVKPLFGSNGRGIARVEDEEIAYRLFRALELERAVYCSEDDPARRLRRTCLRPGGSRAGGGDAQGARVAYQRGAGRRRGSVRAAA